MDISTFRRDAAAMRDGEWVSPGVQYGDLMIKTRALGFRYTDSRNAALAQAARKFGGENRIPSEEQSRISTDCLIRHCLLDVKGLAENGAAIDFKRFCDLIQDPGFGELNSAAFIAASIVGNAHATAVEDAAGN